MTAKSVRVLALMAMVCVGASAAYADVKTEERTQMKLEGMLGRMAGLFGGKAMRDGIVSKVAIKGDRKMSTTGDTGEIVDLTERKVYRLDLSKKTYTVVTFDELRKQFQDAQRKATEQAKSAEPSRGDGKNQEPQLDVDFDLKETGQTRTINGYDCRQVVMTVTVREKGKTLEEAGGLVLVSESWLAPVIAALKEQSEFDMRYAREVYGDLMSVENMQQMASAMAMYPTMKQAIERMNKENVNLSGTPLLTTMSFQSVGSAQQQQQRETAEKDEGGGGLMGGLARRMMRRKPDNPEESGAATPGRVTIMTSTVEVLKVSTDVQAADVSLPPGFKQK